MIWGGWSGGDGGLGTTQGPRRRRMSREGGRSPRAGGGRGMRRILKMSVVSTVERMFESWED